MPPLTAGACIRPSHKLAWQLAGAGTPWVCGICHPPARGLAVAWADGRLERVGEREAAASAEPPATMKSAA